MDDPFDLQRFVEAQQGSYERALQELRDGQKRTHWVWYVFPQLVGLGRSEMAQRYGISGLDEARAYLEHPLLGARLAECAAALLPHRDRSARQVMGSPDDVKLQSSMTLFAAAAPERRLFQQVLDAFYDGKPDENTLARLA
jgi:uncharacterized protein (DUF1810 family)